MSTIVAALDSSVTARAVLSTAIRMGELMGATVNAVHVSDGSVDTPVWLAARRDVPLQVIEGDDVEQVLLDRLAEPDTVAAVFGARGATGGRRPLGHVVSSVLERSHLPIVLVPPEMHPQDGPIRRLLVPLEGLSTSSAAVTRVLGSLIPTDVEIVVLHVFTKSTLPPVLDRPQRDLALWRDEFLARHYPDATGLELRTGSIATRVAEVTSEQLIDLIVLSWSQDTSAGRAAVIRDVLGRSNVPVMLVPVD